MNLVVPSPCETEPYNKRIYYINCSVLQGFLPPRNVVSEHTKKKGIFTCEDIDDFPDINFVSLIVLKFVCVSSKHLRIFLERLRESSEIFGHLRESSEIHGKCSGTFVWPSEQFRKIFGNLRKIVKNAVISKFIFNNYSPKWRWLAVDIYRAAKRRGKYPTLATDTEVNSCFSIY